MPFKSEAQRRLLWMKRPDIAQRWAHEGKKRKKKLPYHVKKNFLSPNAFGVVSKRHSVIDACYQAAETGENPFVQDTKPKIKPKAKLKKVSLKDAQV